MEVLNRAFNIAGDLIDSFCPSGIKAGELGPNSGLIFYVLGGDTVVGVTAVSAMMAGYTFKAVQELVLSQSLPVEDAEIPLKPPYPHSESMSHKQFMGVDKKPEPFNHLESDESPEP